MPLKRTALRNILLSIGRPALPRPHPFASTSSSIAFAPDRALSTRSSHLIRQDETGKVNSLVYKAPSGQRPPLAPSSHDDGTYLPATTRALSEARSIKGSGQTQIVDTSSIRPAVLDKGYIATLERELLRETDVAEQRVLRRKLYYARARGATESTSASQWRRCYELMVSMSADQPLPSMQIQTEEIGMEGAILPIGRPQTIFQEIRGHTGCDVQFADGELERFTYGSNLSLRGTREQIETAKVYIFSSGHFARRRRPVSTIQHGMTAPLVKSEVDDQYSTGLHVSAQGPARNTWDTAAQLEAALQAAHGDDMSSAAEVHALVCSLIRRLPSQTVVAVKERQDNAAMSHIISSALAALFTRRGNIEFITTSAALLAFQYMARHRRHPLIFDIIRDYSGIPGFYHTSVHRTIAFKAYTSIMEACAESEDSKQFINCLGNLARLEFRPDRRAWLSFYTLTSHCMPAQVDQVEKRMYDLNVFTTHNAAANFISKHFPRKMVVANSGRLQPNKDDVGFIQDFLNTGMLKELGIARVNQACIESMIGALLRLGLRENAFYLLQKSELKAVQYSGCWGLFLQEIRHRALQDPGLVIECLQRLQDIQDQKQTSLHQRALALSPTSYQILFRIAYTTRSWNLLRVVWQHASCAHRVTPWMRLCVSRCLAISRFRIVSPNVPQWTHLWNSRFGWYVMDHPRTTGEQDHVDLLTQYLRNPRNDTPKHSLAMDATRAWACDTSLREEGIWPPNDTQHPNLVLANISERAYPVVMKQARARYRSVLIR